MEEECLSPYSNYLNTFDIDISECLVGQSPKPDSQPLSPLMLSPCPEQPMSSGLSPSTTHRNLLELALEHQESSVSSVRGTFSAKSMLLTYSQAPELTRELILQHLQSLDIHSCKLLGAVIGQEQHQDQGIHYHAAAHWTKSRSWTPKAMEILGYHPNIRTHQPGKSTYAESVIRMWKYPQKEDTTPLKWGTEPAMKRSRKDLAIEAISIAETQSVSEAILFMKQQEPFEVIKNYTAIERNLTLMRQAAKRTCPPAHSLTEFKPNIQASIPEELKSLYIWGPSGIGKTQLARAILPEANVISHTDQLRGCDFSKGVIFDDFGVSHWPVTAVIHLCDWEVERGINVKHGHVLIPAHTRKIFTYNNCIEYWMPSNASPEQQIAVKRRLYELELKIKCFIRL